MKPRSKLIALSTFAALFVGAAALQAQPIQLVHPTTQQWKYLAPTTDPAFSPGWEATSFDDTAWPTGTGLFGVETAVYPFPFVTAFPTPSAGAITAYLRTKFTWTGGTVGVVLTGTNYVDDGNVVYLNGVEITRFNMPAGVPTFSTLAPAANPGGFPNVNAGEPVLVQMQIPLDSLTNGNANPLVAGENVLAVEVHNSSTTSSDTVVGMALYAQQIVAPCTDGIQPTNRTVTACRNTTFTVVLGAGCGVPAPTIEWFKNVGGGDVLIAGQTGTSLTITNVQAADAGQYYARLSNVAGIADSPRAQLDVTADTAGPVVVSALALSGNPNAFLLTFDEPIDTTGGNPTTDTFNWAIYPKGGSPVNEALGFISLTPTNIGGLATNAILFVTDLPRASGVNYSYKADAIQDACALNEALNVVGDFSSEVALLTFNDGTIWRYRDDAVDLGTTWVETAYDDSTWRTGLQLFDRSRGDLARAVVAGQNVGTFLDLTNWVATPPTNVPTYYMRVHVNLPVGTTRLQGRAIFDDGYVLYLNGQEVRRQNINAGNEPFAFYGGAGAINAGDQVSFAEISLTNANIGGDNVFAVLLKQNDGTSSDITFGLELLGTVPGILIVPPNIAQQPASATVTEGHTLSLRVSASGSDLTYKWFKDNVEIPNSNTNTYAKLAVPGDAGTYRVEVSNSASTAVSDNAIVTIRPVVATYGAAWRYNIASQDDTLTGTPWYASSFDDSAWSQGNGPFGLETTAATLARMPAPIATPLPAPSATFLTAYFRTRVTAPAVPVGQVLVISHLVDDGAAVYVDGALAFRYNMTNDPPIYSTNLAPVSVPGDGDAVIVSVPLNLTPGEHTIAVEVHQNSATSSDVVFGAEFRLIPAPGRLNYVQSTPNTIQFTWPADPLWNLVSGPTVTGPFAPVAGNPNGSYTAAIPATATNQFYLLRFNGQ